MRYLVPFLLLLVSGTSVAQSNIAREKLSCFQHGQLILDTSDRIREFQEMNNLTQIGEINKGQVSEELIKIYSVDSGNFVCILRSQK